MLGFLWGFFYVEATKDVLLGETNLVVNIHSVIQKVNRTFTFCGCLLGNWC